VHTGPLQLQSRAENLTPTDLPARLISQAVFAGSSLEARGLGPSAITPNISVQVARRLAKLGLSGSKVWVNGPLTGVRPRRGSCGSAQLAIPAADSANFQLELEVAAGETRPEHNLQEDASDSSGAGYRGGGGGGGGGGQRAHWAPSAMEARLPPAGSPRSGPGPGQWGAPGPGLLFGQFGPTLGLERHWQWHSRGPAWHWHSAAARLSSSSLMAPNGAMAT